MKGKQQRSSRHRKTDLNRSSPLLLENVYCFSKFGTMSNLIRLPRLDGLSELSAEVEWSCDIRHTTNREHYPVIYFESRPPRLRNLAIGGPFQPSVNYRRELLGHLHYRKRCN